MATADFSTLRTIHEGQSLEIAPVRVNRTTGKEPTGILAFFATLPRGQRRAKFTMPRQENRKGRYAFDGRSSSVDFLPMTRTRFLITALFLCHQILAPALVTSQLLSGNSAQSAIPSPPKTTQKGETSASDSGTPCANRAMTQLKDGTTICADQQEKAGDVYKLHGNAEVHYRTYVLRADELTYDSDSGEAAASGHFTLDGGPPHDHIRATHGTSYLTAETGRPFARAPPSGPPRPKWQFEAHKVVVDVGGNASIYHSKFVLHGFPIFYFPYATHPVAKEARDTGFLVPTVGRSSTKGNIVGDSFYWAINPSMDATVGAEYFSLRGWSQRGEFRARPSDSSYVNLDFFGVIDRGIGTPPLREGGQEARLTAEGNFYGFRAVSNIDYLSSFLFRLAFNEVFTQAVNSEVKSQLFLSKAVNGFSFGGMVERYQNFFQTTNPDGTPTFDSIRILHTPSADASSVDRPLWRSPFVWSFDASLAGLSRSEPGFHTGELLGRFDFSPEISLPLQFHGWSVRPALTLHETYYTERFVGGLAVDDPTNRQALETSVEVRPPVLEKIFDKEYLGRKWKHVIEPRVVYRTVTGVNDFANVLHFDERDILSNTHEVEYAFVTRLYAKRSSALHIQECDTPMTGLSVGAAAPEQTVPWPHVSQLESQPCTPGPEAREVATWEVDQKYFLDPTFGGALVTGQRNVFTTTEALTGIAFATEPRHLPPLESRLRVATGSHRSEERR